MTADSPSPGATPTEGPATRDRAALNAYVAQYYGKYTDAALTDHLLQVGHQRSDIEAALRTAAAADVLEPVNARARTIVRLLYLLTYGVLVAGMLANSTSGGAGVIGTVVLTVVLGLAFVMAVVWLRRRGSRDRAVPSGMLTMLAVPLVLLVLVAGTCLATGLPFPTTYPY